MDPLDPTDSIPFADEDPVVTDFPTSTTATSQAFTVVEDAGHSSNVSQGPEKLSSPAADATLLENGAEKNQTSSETSENRNGELAANNTSDSVDQCSAKEDPDTNEAFPDQINLNEKPDEKPDEENLKACKEKVDIFYHEGPNDVPGEVNGHIRQQTQDILPVLDDSVGSQSQIIIQQTSDSLTDKQTEDVILQALDIIDSQTQPVQLLTPEKEDQDGEDMEEEGADAAEGSHPSDQLLEDAAAMVTLAPTEEQWGCEENEVCVSQEDQPAAATEPTEQPGTESGTESCVESSQTMDSQGETHGGRTAAGIAEDLVDDFFGTTSTSDIVANGVEEEDSSQCVLRIDESVDGTEKDNSAWRPGLDKESSPEIIVGSVDSVENVTLKDATSEKSLLGSRDDRGSSSQKDSLSSRTDEDKRKSSSDLDLDFAVLEMDSCHLNLAMSKQKTSLRKRGSLARRKKPSRGSVNQLTSDSSDSMFQDSTDAKPLSSPTSDMAEDEVFDKQAKAATESPQRKLSTSGESYTVRKAAQPFKPSLIMPGLQDLSKSKLFNQERTKSDECSTSPAKSLSPTHHPVPPLVLPKPTTKIQKDSQNKTIAAENLALSSDLRAEASDNVSNSTITASVEEAQVVCKEMHSDSATSSEGPKLRSDSGSLMGPRFTRTDSWSSVSSPRTMSRRESTSSVEGGEGGSAHSTPRRASIQGSAYAPIGFRPRRSSSIVLDSNNKLVDLPAPLSPAPSSPSTLEKDSETVISSGVKSPIFTPPVWLSEMKAKPETAAGDFSARLRSTSMGSNDGSAVSASSSQSRNSCEIGDGGQGQKVTDERPLKKQDEEEPQRPSWMKAAQHRTSHVSEKLPSKDVEENGDEDDKKPVPPWAAELKKKNRPFVSPRISKTAGESNGKTYTAPLKGISDKENTPAVNSGRDDYSPSWMKSSQQGKKPPPPAVASKPTVSIGSKPATKDAAENPMKQYETPKWKLALAEKKKRREAEMMPVEESGYEASGNSPSDSTDSSSTSSSVPQWRQQLSLRKKQPHPDVVKEAEDGGPGPNWAKQSEERRARLMKTGLFEQAKAAEES